ncbi:hypothetical protein BDN67DRAFT_972908 [Paxillus ammoniavirescens]|nr:hypothetical protein BDN67DRAFT_972908 [Paxillus ammoniavirescens]
MSTSDPPISRLPDELLIIIFDCFITSSPPPDKFPFAVSVPTLLSHVSRRWRTIISMTPSFWTQVPISPYQSARTLQSFLHHSLPLPISVTVYQWPRGLADIHRRTLSDQLERLTAKADRERIHGLRIEGDSADHVIGTFLDPRRSGRYFPALRRISLSRATNWMAWRFFDDGSAPVLKSLVLEDSTMNSFSNLRLRTPQSLTTLVWKCSDEVMDCFWLSATIELFSYVVTSFPNLTALELYGPVIAITEDNEGDPRLVPYVRAIARRQLAPLTNIKSLRIAHPFTSPTSPLEFFRLLPSLTHIVVGGRAEGEPHLASSTLCVLRGLAGSPEALPLLEKVCLEFTGAELNSSLRKVVRDEVKTWLEGRESMRAVVSVPSVMVNGERVGVPSMMVNGA